jgi:hypothetical protein
MAVAHRRTELSHGRGSTVKMATKASAAEVIGGAAALVLLSPERLSVADDDRDDSRHCCRCGILSARRGSGRYERKSINLAVARRKPNRNRAEFPSARRDAPVNAKLWLSA